jgi:competence protein ComEC
MEYTGAGYRLAVLYPFAGAPVEDANDRSCVIMLEWAGQRFLMMGDLGAGAERALVERYGAGLEAEVLIAAHHGSGHSTRYALLKQVKPRYVVFSAGYRNRFGHPHPDVLKRVAAMDGIELNTALDGALQFVVRAGHLQVESVRQRAAPFWVGDFRMAQP